MSVAVALLGAFEHPSAARARCRVRGCPGRVSRFLVVCYRGPQAFPLCDAHIELATATLALPLRLHRPRFVGEHGTEQNDVHELRGRLAT